jgi:hypothetical protein
MNEDAFRVMELAMQGYQCSQILMIMALEAQGKSNLDLVRAMSGLLGGMGTGKACGALTAGCCVLALHAGKGAADVNVDDRLQPMLACYVEWFETEYTPRYGGIDCATIVQDDMRNRAARCPGIVLESLAKIKELLTEFGYEFNRTAQPA